MILLFDRSIVIVSNHNLLHLLLLLDKFDQDSHLSRELLLAFDEVRQRFGGANSAEKRGAARSESAPTTLAGDVNNARRVGVVVVGKQRRLVARCRRSGARSKRGD